MSDELWMERCLDLAALGAGHVSPNPMVGAVLVYQGRIIGEGYHREIGGPHAEVQAIASVKPNDRHLLPDATLYVNLEPCCHQGRTPPCTNLILEQSIPKVVAATEDPSAKVSGKGLGILREHGVSVQTGVLENEALWLNRRFIIFHQEHRPYVILKWAQSANGFMGRAGERVKISAPITDRLVHKWRAEEDSILIGTNTAKTDNPHLTVRLWPGRSPLRAVVDTSNSLPRSAHLFSEEAETIVLHHREPSEMMAALFDREVLSVMVEGGAMLLGSFIRAGLWDEARVIVSPMRMDDGVAAPVLPVTPMQQPSGPDQIHYFRNEH